MIVSRVLRTWGESESGLNERLDGVIAELDALGNPTLAFLASGWEGLKVRLTAKAESDAAVRGRCSTSGSGACASVVGELVFGVDDDTMESVVLDLLRTTRPDARAGRVGHRRPGRRPGSPRSPGASDVLRGSIVSYASEVKYSTARRAGRPGGQRGGGAGDGAGRALGCWAATWGWR